MVETHRQLAQSQVGRHEVGMRGHELHNLPSCTSGASRMEFAYGDYTRSDGGPTEQSIGHGLDHPMPYFRSFWRRVARWMPRTSAAAARLCRQCSRTASMR